jgi:hypothetical protein
MPDDPRMKPPRSSRLAIALALGTAFAAPAAAWHTSGHNRVARAAAAASPAELPAFFRQGADAIGEAAIDPDLMKDRVVPIMRVHEYPEHYLDWELLGDPTLPPGDRYALVALLAERQLTPRQVGFLPYAVAEGVDRLAMAFAEHRRWPDDARIQQKALLYAGLLAHYGGDLEQPLHTSVHHDGRALPDGSSPHTGIHTLVDGLFDMDLDVATLTRDLAVRDHSDLWAGVLAEITASHALLDRVYELEPALREAARPGPEGAAATAPSPALRAFAEERFRTTAGFLASLFYTAWQRSATIELPRWHDRQPAPPPEPAPTPTPGAVIILRPRPDR